MVHVLMLAGKIKQMIEQNSIKNVFSESINVESTIGPITQIILQPTSYCNLKCKYCYLSEKERSTKTFMNYKLPADAIKFAIDSGYANKDLVVTWHAGEPLAIGIDFYHQAIEYINNVIPQNYSIQYSVQTNATYITKKWCDLFKKYKFNVGISIDGPEFIHNANRITSKGSGTYDLVLRGINILRDNDIKFECVSTITEEWFEYPEPIYYEFTKILPEYWYMGIEQSVGYNASLSRTNNFIDKYTAFLKKMHVLQQDGKVKISEFRTNERNILSANKVISHLTQPFFILNVDSKGNISTYSPELLSLKDKHFTDFILGNIYKNTLDKILKSKKFHVLNNEIQDGVSNCRKNCDYFSLCGGGSPSHKLAETGKFNVSETIFCINKIKLPINIVIEHLSQQII